MVIFLHTIALAVNHAVFEQGTGPVLLSDVICTGNESSLLSCSHSGTNLRYCSHFNDAGVVCPSCKYKFSMNTTQIWGGGGGGGWRQSNEGMCKQQQLGGLGIPHRENV